MLIKSVPGNVSLESMLTEIRKLRATRAIGLPSDLFADIARRSSLAGAPGLWSNPHRTCATIPSR
ncbi:hypothetical protein [Micromonospora sp. SH-82]|uniref:hypothetical protein n=1 Tax=Micromonospora sp. SH-82 TaxID=3132938 RepID=UPI003EC14FB6